MQSMLLWGVTRRCQKGEPRYYGNERKENPKKYLKAWKIEWKEHIKVCDLISDLTCTII